MRNFPQALITLFIFISHISFAAHQSSMNGKDVAYNDAANQVLRASLQTGGGAKLTLTPSSVAFANTVVGTSAQKQVTLSASNGTVTIASKQLDNSEFSVSGLALPLTLASGHSIRITVRFKPQSSGQALGKLSLLSSSGSLLGVDQFSGTGVAPSAHRVSLSWAADTSPVIGYNIYRGTQSGGPYARINTALEASTNYADATVKSGATYFYAATAVNAKGQESGYSVPIKVAIPFP